MRMTRRIIFSCFVVIFIHHISYAGGGWTSGKRHGFFKIGQSFIIADQYFTPAGDIIPITTIGQYISAFYGEYGLTDRLDVITYAPFFSRATLNQLNDINDQLITDGDELNAVGDIDLSIKYALIKNRPIVLSATLTLGLPTGVSSGGRSGSLQTGDGEFNQMVGVDLSRSLGEFYATTSISYNHRTKKFNDELRYGLEVGRSIGDWFIIMRLNGVKPIDNGSFSESGQINGLFGNNIEYLAFTPEIVYQPFSRVGFSASVGRAFYAKRILASPNYGFGVFLKL
ncbi:MAG: hypothetical protein ACI92W_000025 [Paraglaciecola sp.]